MQTIAREEALNTKHWRDFSQAMQTIAKAEALDKKGISAERRLSHVLTATKHPDTNRITGNRKRDLGIRQHGLKRRYDYLKIQRSYAPTKAMRNCSRFTIASLIKSDDKGRYMMVKEKGKDTKRRHYIAEDSEVPDMVIKSNEYGSTITGLQTCDNPNCVMCARHRSMERAEKIDGVLKWTATGSKGQHWSRYFVTLTIQRQPCAKKAAQDVQKRWRTVQKALQYRYKGRRLAFSRAVDVTFRPDLIAANQCYHVHLHCIVLIEGVAPLNEVRSHILKAWKSGGDWGIVVNDEGQDVQEIHNNEKLSKYVAKMGGLGLELASSQTKKGRGGSLSLPQVMQEIIEGRTELRRLYREYLEMMQGVRTMSFSKTFNELSDEWEAHMATLQTAEQSTESKDYCITVPPVWWAAVIAMQSPIVQAVFWYRHRQHDRSHIKTLEALFQLNPPDKSMLLEKWCEGSLKAWHVDALRPCLE